MVTTPVQDGVLLVSRASGGCWGKGAMAALHSYL